MIFKMSVCLGRNCSCFCCDLLDRDHYCKIGTLKKWMMLDYSNSLHVLTGKEKMKITVVGLGYVGLSNAVLLAQHNEVIGVDINQDRVDAVNAKTSPCRR